MFQDRCVWPVRGALLAAVLVVCSACHSSSTAPTTTTTETSLVDVFEGALEPGTTAARSFTAPAAGSLKLTLASVTVDVNQPLTSPVTVGFGTLNGAECAVSTTARVAPSLTAQVTGTVAAGTFCVTVSDPDSQLSSTVTFALMVVTGSPSLPVTSSGTSTWTTNIGAGGISAATRSIYTSAAGTLRVSLDSLSYAEGQLGIGLGVPVAAGCAVAQVSVGGASTTIAAPVDSGVYCVKVYDAGRTTGIVNFSTTIIYP
jgi:hypothetical protein